MSHLSAGSLSLCVCVCFYFMTANQDGTSFGSSLPRCHIFRQDHFPSCHCVCVCACVCVSVFASNWCHIFQQDHFPLCCLLLDSMTASQDGASFGGSLRRCHIFRQDHSDIVNMPIKWGSDRSIIRCRTTSETLSACWSYCSSMMVNYSSFDIIGTST